MSNLHYKWCVKCANVTEHIVAKPIGKVKLKCKKCGKQDGDSKPSASLDSHIIKCCRRQAHWQDEASGGKVMSDFVVMAKLSEEAFVSKDERAFERTLAYELSIVASEFRKERQRRLKQEGK